MRLKVDCIGGNVMFKKKTKSQGVTNKSWSATVSKDFRINKSLYIMFIPVIIYILVFKYGPMYGALIAFKDYRPSLGMLESPWVGFKHFINFLTSPSFAHIFGNTIRISIWSLIWNFPTPIILALLLNELKSLRFSKIVQNITYIPHFISLVIVCGMVKEFTMDTGIISQFLAKFGMEPVTMLNQPSLFLPVYIGSALWQGIGWASIVYLAALTSVDDALIEAAIIDGAGKWKQLIHVKIPAIIPTISTMLILSVGGILSVGYEKIILLYNDITMEVADVISTYVYRKGLLEQSWSFSTAVSIFNSVINLILLFSANKITAKLEGGALW